MNLPLTLVRYIFEVVLIFRDIHQCYLAMAPSGYYKFQVVHFDLIPVEAFLADSKIKVKLEILFQIFTCWLPGFGIGDGTPVFIGEGVPKPAFGVTGDGCDGGPCFGKY